ncbi:YoaK family protein [Flavobacterium sp. I3-2]|uniref:YoaK family protein n=1 Tax=Flavobacterium sp. I3-2 TaxID=2748319 RepID=UPI0015ADF83C|nr:YoaK family protein [Flavobacterium sp. I3-2]
MLRKFSTSRTLSDNIKLGGLTAFTAGTINIASLIIFLNFTSNITGHYAILSAEISKGNWGQVGVVALWIILFFLGNFLSNLIVINVTKFNQYLAHALPLVLEIICLIFVGYYGNKYYSGQQNQTELLVALMLFSTGLQNGLTASISNFAIKTTHLTGTTTDLGILFSMFTMKKYRKNKALVSRAKVLLVIVISYLLGAIFAGIFYHYFKFYIFYLISVCLLVVIVYDFYKIYARHFSTEFRYHKIYKRNDPIVLFLIRFKQQNNTTQTIFKS